MRRLIYFIVGLIIWLLLTWPINEGKIDIQVVITGIIAALLVAIMFHEMLPKEHYVFISPVRLFWFLLYLPVFFYYILKANLDVVYRALHPKMPINPGIVKIETTLKSSSAITALANSITLTPGTLTVDLIPPQGSEKCVLYIHWINVRSKDTEQASKYIARKFEWFIQKIFE